MAGRLGLELSSLSSLWWLLVSLCRRLGHSLIRSLCLLKGSLALALVWPLPVGACVLRLRFLLRILCNLRGRRGRLMALAGGEKADLPWSREGFSLQSSCLKVVKFRGGFEQVVPRNSFQIHPEAPRGDAVKL